MASSREYLQDILEQLPGLEQITYRAVMGKFILRYRWRIAGEIYDDRLPIRLVDAAASRLRDARRERSYEGVGKILLVGRMDGRQYLTETLEAIYEQLPAPKSRKADRTNARKG